VDRKYLFEVLKEFGIPKKLVNLIKMALIESNCRVKIQGQLSSNFKVKVGLRQGDALSTILFNIVLEKVIRNIEINPNGTIFNRTRQYLAHVDEVVILGISVRATEEVLAQIRYAALKAGLVINESKTKYMRILRNETGDRSDLRVEGMVFEEAITFKYLGSLIIKKNEIGEEIKMRIAAGNRCYYGLQLFRSRTVSRIVKIKIYKTILKPVVVFGCEAWSMTEKDKTRLNMWERKILRRVYGPVTEQGVWRIRRNEELRELYKAPDLVADIKT
jgi:hypothetical protein